MKIKPENKQLAKAEIHQNMLIRLHSQTRYNSTKLSKKLIGSCCNCGSKVAVSEIVDWCDSGNTAICPICDVDSIIPGNINLKIINEISLMYFQ